MMGRNLITHICGGDLEVMSVYGLVTPQASSLLHNASTVALSLRNAGSYRT